MNQSFDFEDFPVAQEAEGPATGSPIYNSPEIQQMGNALGVACSTLSEEIPVSYKRTEVGVIPEDWKVMRLGEIGTFSKGSGIKREDISETGVPCIRYGELYTRYHNYISEPVSRIPLNVACQALPVASGDLLFAGSGETTEEIGRCSAYIGAEQAYAGGDIIVFKPIGQNPIFLGHLMNFSTIATQKSRMGQGDAVVHISARNLAQVQVGLPPLSEQCAIAEVLADVDGLLGALEALIAKNRAIKQAAMQQLLTGKTRLPGFSGTWKTMPLRDLVEIRKGQLITISEAIFGSVPVIAGGKTPAYFHNEANRRGKTITISGSGAYAGYVTFFNQPIFASDCSTISEADSYSIEFVYFCLKMHQEDIYRRQTGGAQPHVHPSDLHPMRICVPSVVEQHAIATVLSDIDIETAALEVHRKKTCAVKQGMMQQLLTGRVRLV